MQYLDTGLGPVDPPFGTARPYRALSGHISGIALLLPNCLDSGQVLIDDSEADLLGDKKKIIRFRYVASVWSHDGSATVSESKYGTFLPSWLGFLGYHLFLPWKHSINVKIQLNSYFACFLNRTS